MPSVLNLFEFKHAALCKYLKTHLPVIIIYALCHNEGKTSKTNFANNNVFLNDIVLQIFFHAQIALHIKLKTMKSTSTSIFFIFFKFKLKN